MPRKPLHFEPTGNTRLQFLCPRCAYPIAVQELYLDPAVQGNGPFTVYWFLQVSGTCSSCRWEGRHAVGRVTHSAGKEVTRERKT